MSQYSQANLKFVGSHAGVSIGEDGASQMGLEDVAMFRSVLTSTVLHPCDATSTERLAEAAAGSHRDRVSAHDAAEHAGHLRQHRVFSDRGKQGTAAGATDRLTLVGAGATVHEALNACDPAAA